MQPQAGGFWPKGAQPETDDTEKGMTAENISGSSFSSAFNGYDLTEQPVQSAPQAIMSDEIEWEASEYVQHDKDAGWFIILVGITLLILAAALFLRQWTFAALVVAMAVAIVVYARRPPRTLHYRLSMQNLSIEDRAYNYEEFKAFGVTKDGPLHMITLLPRKRFAPPLSIYFESEDGEQIVDILAAHMPLTPLKHDRFEEIARKLRF